MKIRQMLKKKSYISIDDASETGRGPEVPEGIMKKCNACKGVVFTDDVISNNYICPKCHNYFRVHARRRVDMVTDAGTFESWDEDLTTGNPMEYPGYEEKIKAAQTKTQLKEAVLTGKARIGGYPVALGVMDSRFIMASMGEVVGERITRMVERATEQSLPVIIFACSGGARMQEGITSLMQMAKTSAALKRHSDAGGFYISMLTNPTTGGVTASFAMLGDVILAEPGALIGFAGPRVIEQTIGQKLPKGFQTSEFLLEHGFIDKIVERSEMKEVLTNLLKMHEDKKVNFPHNEHRSNYGYSSHGESAWERVEKSRKKDRPVGTDYISTLFPDFIELHGDRGFGDDKAIVGGVATFFGRPVTVITQEKGRTTKENVLRNFGMPSPEGYRKALRLMKQAEKFHRPVICFVDTPGAFCGLEAEERGQGEAIARNIYEMSALKVPVLSVIIGEGGSGGALAMATSNEVWMLENSIYSILSPEGFASILWKDSNGAKKAAELMKLTAEELKSAGIVEHVIREPEDFTIETLPALCQDLGTRIGIFLGNYENMDSEKIVEMRYNRFRQM